MNDIMTYNNMYGETVSLKDIYDIQMITDKLPEGYLPEINTDNNTYVLDSRYYDEDNNVMLVRFIPIDNKGQVIGTYRDIECDIDKVVLLMRISIPSRYKLEEYLNIDYIVDVSKIKYSLNSDMEIKGNDIIQTQSISFENIEFSDYYNENMNWDNNIKEFSIHKDYFLFNVFR